MTSPRPNLFIVGAPKCGTTAWVSYLARHPDIFFCDPKEPHYFNTDIPQFRWVDMLERYLELFSNAAESKIIGEASILYLYSKVAADNIYSFDPAARIIAFVRSPGEFIPSYHQQQLYNLDEDESDLARAWTLSGQRSSASLPDGCRDARLIDYKSIGLFGEQVERYITRFGEQQVRIVRFEDWIVNPLGTYRLMLNFLNLADNGETSFEKVNAAHDHRSLLIARMTQRPPTAARLISRAIRKIPGLEALRPARLLRSFNRREGYRGPNPDPVLLEQIRKHYAADQAKLDRLFEKCGLHSREPLTAEIKSPEHSKERNSLA